MLGGLIIIVCNVALSAALGSQETSATTAAAYCSSSDGTYQLSQIAGPVKGSTSGSAATWNLSIDDTSSGLKQAITGFGAALTDAAVATINNLTSTLRTQLLQEVLNTTSGAGFGLMRHTIGSSDLSADPAYTYDDTASPDTNLTHFDITDRGRAMASLLAQMKQINPKLFVLGTSWSPPGWMKENGALDGGVGVKNRLSDRYINQTEPDYSTAFANYFVKYFQEFQEQGINVDAIAIQNEPLNNRSGYPTMYMNGSEAGGIILNHVGPALASVSPTPVIWGGEDNTGPQADLDSAQAYLDIASKYVKALAWHCYFDPKTGAPGLDWSVLTAFYTANKAKYPNLKQYMTECNTPAPANGGHWYGAANFTMGPLQNWASGALSWTLSTNIYNTTDPNGALVTEYGPHLSSGGCSNCRGLITVTNSTHYDKNIAFYMLAQFSKYIPQGATVLNGTGSTQIVDGVVGVQAVGTLNPDSTRTLVILNTEGNDLSVVLKTGSGEIWNGGVPRLSVVTWVLPKAS